MGWCVFLFFFLHREPGRGRGSRARAKAWEAERIQVDSSNKNVTDSSAPSSVKLRMRKWEVWKKQVMFGGGTYLFHMKLPIFFFPPTRRVGAQRGILRWTSTQRRYKTTTELLADQAVSSCARKLVLSGEIGHKRMRHRNKLNQYESWNGPALEKQKLPRAAKPTGRICSQCVDTSSARWPLDWTAAWTCV